MEIALKKIVSDYNRDQGLTDDSSTSSDNPLVKVFEDLNIHR
jgi:hypothetical protein